MSTTIWFDVDQTLVGYDRSFDTILQSVLPEASSGVSTRFREIFVDQIARCESSPYTNAFREIVDEFDFGVDPETASAEYIDAKVAATTTSHRVIELLRELGETCHVGVLTNGVRDVQRRILARHDLLHTIDESVISTEEGIAKPSPQLFEVAKKRLPAKTHIYVGDAFEEDIVPARQADFDTIHVRNDGGPQVSIDKIESLGVVTQLFDREDD
jgi:HAD superfamily hydrolase (TIGR01549 family)